MTFECFVQFPVSLELIVDALGPKRILGGNPSFEHLKFVFPLRGYRVTAFPHHKVRYGSKSCGKRA